jgi:hypothetical protein
VEGRPEEGDHTVLGTPEGIETVQKVISATLEAMVGARVEHQAVFEKLARIDELSRDEVKDLNEALESLPFVPIDLYDSETSWRLGERH